MAPLACQKKSAGSGTTDGAQPKGASQSPANGDAPSVATAATAKPDSAAAPESKVNLPVVTEDARNGDLILTVSTTGQVRSDAEVKLKAEVGGVAQKVLVRPGDRVKAGDPLLVLDPRPFDLDLRAAEVAVMEADQRAKDNYVPDSVVSGKGPAQQMS